MLRQPSSVVHKLVFIQKNIDFDASKLISVHISKFTKINILFPLPSVILWTKIQFFR